MRSRRTLTREVMRKTHLIDATLVKDVPPRFESYSPISNDFSERDLENEVDDDFGILTQAFVDSREETFRFEYLRFESSVSSREERENQKDEESSNIGFRQDVCRSGRTESSLVQSSRDFRTPPERAKEFLCESTSCESNEDVAQSQCARRDVVPSWVQGSFEVGSVFRGEEGLDKLWGRRERIGREEPNQRGEARKDRSREGRAVRLFLVRPVNSLPIHAMMTV